MNCDGRVWQTRGTPIEKNPINHVNQTNGKTNNGLKVDRMIDPLYESILNEQDDFDHEAYAGLDMHVDETLRGLNLTSKRRGAAKDKRPSPAYLYRYMDDDNSNEMMAVDAYVPTGWY